jgi:hypothetical protein
VETAEDVKGDFVGGKGVGDDDGGDPGGAGDEDALLAVEVGDAAPEEEEAAEGEGVGGYDPLEALLGDGEGCADGGEDDDDGLEGEGLGRVSEERGGRALGRLAFMKLAPVRVATRPIWWGTERVRTG